MQQPASTPSALAPDGKDHVLAAMRTLLADGKARTPRELTDEALAEHLLPDGTNEKYVYNALNNFCGRQRLKGQRPDFIHLPDGRFRLNVPLDLFGGHPDPSAPDKNLEAFIDMLQRSAQRKIAPDPNDGANVGAPFERAVTQAFALLGFVSVHDGSHAQPDVVASAPLGATAYTLAIECKTFDQEPPKMVETSAPAEAARLRDQINADFAVLVGPQFTGVGSLDQELAMHKVALWLVDDVGVLLRANAAHPIEWPALLPLFAPGRRSDAIFDFCFAHLHGKWERAHVTLRYVLEAGLEFQRKMLAEEHDAGRPDSPLTAEVLTELVNERLRAEGDVARIGVDDVRQAVEVASNPPINALRTSGGAITVTRLLLPEPAI